MDYAILAILLILSSFFSGIELAYFSLSKIQIKELVSEKRKNAHLVEKLRSDPQRLLITILIGNNLVNIFAASYATVVATKVFGDSGVGIATGVMTILILIFGEITPKSFCSQNAVKISLKFAKTIIALEWAFIFLSYPLGKLVQLMTGKETEAPLVTDEYVKKLTKIGIEEGTVAHSESEMISNIFHLHDLTASDLMTPMSQAVLINADETISSVKNMILNSAYSRLPVFKSKPDNIVGLVQKDDILEALAEGEEHVNSSITDYMRMAHFCQDSISAHSLLRKMQTLRTHMCVVKSQGVASGIVTMEDVLEELVGDILDESDLEEQFIRRLSRNQILALGKTQLIDINNFFNIRLKNSGTIDSYLKSIFDTIPEEGEKIRIDNIMINIVDSDSERIKVVKITKMDPEAE